MHQERVNSSIYEGTKIVEQSLKLYEFRRT